MKLKCKNPRHGKGGYEWNYKGKSDFYASCPRCHKLVRVIGEKNA